jgi:hypothetical protein
MAKLLFVPVSVSGGLLAGFVSKKIFDALWGVVDDEEPPDSKHRKIDWRKLLLAAAVQGAIFRAVKEATDHYSRRVFWRTTGVWPGEERPKDELHSPVAWKPEVRQSGRDQHLALPRAHDSSVDDRPSRPLLTLITDA